MTLRPLLTSATLTAAALLYAYPTSRFYPSCPIHDLTGLQCPGCGATRALAALLHAHWQEAWHQNPLIIILLPLFILFLTLKKPVPPRAIYALLVLTTVFTVTRNLPL